MNIMFYVTYPLTKNAPVETLTFKDLLRGYTPPAAVHNPGENRMITRIYDRPYRIPTSVQQLHKRKAQTFTTL